ncbi:MAG: alanine--tRNA ligase [Deltaproteobacteria bacterium]|nr:alanine--tRNA ligase [Deltaproteobacteria bacterium]
MTGNEIRKKFLDFFAEHGHRVVRSSSLVPADDPTLLFTNAGMVQFKRVFLGEEKRDYTRASTSQKCVRAGGKHNDLENVGHTARHHTFFEMLGNFSFGDYFKNDAIKYAWTFLVDEIGLNPNDLWVSVYKDDDEAYEIWKNEVGLSEDRIVRLGDADNFWSMGETGPCGPCSEILIDRGPALGCASPDCKPGCDCDRYLEIWNLVFMQYNRDAKGSMTPLPKPSIDTGMGLERIAAVVQDVSNNFETDLFAPIISKISSLCNRASGEDKDADIAMKVIADHSRAAAFLVSDGVLPSNEGRGYVLRRIMRRAIRYGRNIGLTRPFLHETVEPVFDIMSTAYPGLKREKTFITSVIQNEEERFSETLDNGLKLLAETLDRLFAHGEKTISGEVIFKLYDTYGFPVDIVKDVVAGRDFVLDMDGFNMSMERQREQSRTRTQFSDMAEAYQEFAASLSGLPKFVGYDRMECEGKILLMVAGNERIETAMSGQAIELVADPTPFYAESGGQAGDCGIISGHNFIIQVDDTVKDPAGLIIHKGKMVSGTAKTGEPVNLSVDLAKRAETACNHTATHLLHAALRQVLGDHVRQAGSHVAADRLRFDFTHFSRLESEHIEKTERIVNGMIRANRPVATDEMDADAALKSGAMALFEEKYGDSVRVVHIDDFSRELCGGTHTVKTGDIGIFVIVSESSVASGVRRIEALTGDAALAAIQMDRHCLLRAARLLKEKPESLDARIKALISTIKEQEKTIEKLTLKLAVGPSDSGGNKDEFIVSGIRLIAKRVEADNPGALRNMADRFKDRLDSGIVILGAEADGKAMFVTSVTKDLVAKFNAGKIVKELAAVVGGKGGGRPDMAQAGGPDAVKLDDAIGNAAGMIKKMAESQ